MPSPESPSPSGSTLQKLVRPLRNKSFSHWQVLWSKITPYGEGPHPDPMLFFLAQAAFCLQGCCLQHHQQLSACCSPRKASSAATGSDLVDVFHATGTAMGAAIAMGVGAGFALL